MKKYLYPFILIFAFTFSVDLKAQPPGPGGGTDPKPNCANPPCVPIDGGLSFLLIAGAALGSKKIYDHKKSKEEDQLID